MLSSYLKYLLRRKNEYHVHSPFVYALYTKAIRGRQPEALKDLGIEDTVVVTGSEIPEGGDKVMFVVEGIHENKQKEAFWDTICAHPDVNLTIDLYHRGLFFYREGMEKQNFILRR